MSLNKLVKKIALSIILIMCSGLVSAQLKNETHNFSLYLTGGYSNFIHSTKDAFPIGFLGGGLGIGYEYRSGKFYMHFGAEVMSLNSATQINNFEHTESAFDTEGDIVHYNYKFNSWFDYQYSAYVNVPLIFGYNTKGIYVGGGLKFGLPIWGSSTVIADYATTGIYDKYIGEFMNMPNHFYTNYRTEAIEPLTFSPNVALIFEIGGNVWESKPKKRNQGRTALKIGAYAEYGVLNVMKNETIKPLMNINPSNASNVTMSTLFNSIGTDTFKSLNPLYIGIKATLLFEIKTPKRCSCLQTKRGLSIRKNSFRR